MSRWLLVFALLIAAHPAYARDYDRNDVAERELTIGFGLSPLDVDTRNIVYCTGKQTICEANVQRANLLTARGVARKHLRRFYLAGELEAGATLPAGNFPMHPWLAVGGMVGLETADNAWTTLRGFADLGVLVGWADTRLAESLTFTAEAGVRYQLQSTERPHMLLNLGVRGLYNFSHVGVMGFAGIGWTFD